MAHKSADESSLDSKYFIDREVYNCAFCNRRNVVYHIVNVLRFNWNAQKLCYVYMIRCSSCSRISMHLSFDPIHEDVGTYVNTTTKKFKHNIDLDAFMFYSVPTSFFTIDIRIPNIIRELTAEAEGCRKMNFLTGASACVRKSIYELLVYEECEGQNYEDRIKYLKCKYPSIDAELFNILSHIQQMTSEKVHEQSWDKWDSSTITFILETMKAVLYEIYVVPAEKKQRRDEISRLRKLTVKKSNEF